MEMLWGRIYATNSLSQYSGKKAPSSKLLMTTYFILLNLLRSISCVHLWAVAQNSCNFKAFKKICVHLVCTTLITYFNDAFSNRSEGKNKYAYQCVRRGIMLKSIFSQAMAFEYIYSQYIGKNCSSVSSILKHYISFFWKMACCI